MTEQAGKKGQLLCVLREGINLIQMLLFKELKKRISADNPDRDQMETTLLAGAITGEIFAAQHPDQKFVHFRTTHREEIERMLLSLRQHHQKMCVVVTDALRMQVLCDYQEGIDSSKILVAAQKFGYLVEQREIPLPSSFMTTVRQLGHQHNLVIAPLEISSQQDNDLLC